MRDVPPIPDPFSRGQELADRELVDRLLGGDGQAAKTFVHLHQHLVMREIRRFRNLSPETREDLLQEIYAKLFEGQCRALAQWKGNSNFVAYLRKIVRNICIDLLRALDRAPPTEPIGEDEEELADRDGTKNPEREAQLNELRKLMRLAIQSLAPPDQEILNLIGIKESSYEQAAKLLGISVNLAGVRLSEAKKRLGKIIKQSYPELLLYLPDEDP